MKKNFILSVLTMLCFGIGQNANAQTQGVPAMFTPTPGAVTFVDLSTEPGSTNLGQGDDVLFTVTLPFPFSIYGQAATTAMDVSTNGWVGDTGNTSSDLGNSCPYPDPTGGTLPRLAIYHDDLDMEVGSVSSFIYTKSFPANSSNHPGHPNLGTDIDCYMIHYKDAQDFPGVDNPSSTQIFNFAAVLYDDGSVALLYADDMSNADQNGATTAIQGPSGAETLPGCNTTGYIQSDVYFLESDMPTPPPGGNCFTIGGASGELTPVLKAVSGVCGPAAVPTDVCDCPTGYVVVGYEGLQGNPWGPMVLDQFSLRCKELNQNGSLGNTVIVTCSNGTAVNNNTPAGPVDAGAGQAMVGGQLRIGCAIDAVIGFSKPISEIISGDPNSNNTQMAQMGGSGGSLGPLQIVPTGNVIVGMQGYEDQNGGNTNNVSGGVAWRYAPIESCGGGGSGECNATNCVILTCPDDVTVSCYEDYEIDAENAAAVFTCGSEAFRYVTQPHITGAANCPGTTYVITYKVGDNQGNVGCCDQVITIENDAPSIDVIPGEQVSCYDEIEVLNEDATVTTSCSEGFDLKILPPVVEGTFDCPGSTYTYTYRVRDNCGREVTADRVFTIVDNAPPSIVAPPDMTVSCDWNFNLNPDYAEVTTGCTLGYTTTVSGPTTSGAANCPGSTYTYTYTVTDDCGRTASDVRTFTIANDAPTFLNCPAVPLQLNCEDDGWENVIQAWLASVEAEDACGNSLSVSNNYNPNTQGLCINNGTKVVRFFATDNCGRTSLCEGMIIIADTEPPVFVTAPQDELVVCNYITQDKLDAWVDAHGGAEVEDCWDNVSWSTFPNNPTINCAGNMSPTSITVEFVATDGCGNKSSMEATFTALPAMGNDGGNTEDVAVNDKLQLLQNQPNPFVDETSISFYLPESGKATLSIYDISGKLLKEIRGDYKQGMNVEIINRSELQGAGLLYYQLSTTTETATKRMILLD